MAAMALEAHVREDSGPVIELVGDVDGRAEEALGGRVHGGGGAAP